MSTVTAILLTAAVVGVVGLIVGLLLVTAAEKFKIETDENEAAIRAALPGNNCGGCGFPGCDGLAAAIAKGEAPVDACPVGGAAVGEKISKILGTDAPDMVKKVAFVRCAGDCDTAKEVCNYVGITDCRAASVVPGRGAKACEKGCKGYGSCVQACQFDAIHVVSGVAVVDRSKCTGCGQCASICPNGLIVLIPETAKYVVQCNSQDKGKIVKEACSAGCLGCTACVRQCEYDAIAMNGNVAVIDQGKCQKCGKCADKCPAKIIREQ